MGGIRHGGNTTRGVGLDLWCEIRKFSVPAIILIDIN